MQEAGVARSRAAAVCSPAIVLVVGRTRRDNIANVAGYHGEGGALGRHLLTYQSNVGMCLQSALQRDVAGCATHQPHEVVVLSGRKGVGMQV